MLKKKLRAREDCLIVNIDYPSTGLTSVIARSGADGVFIDCEQGPIGIESLEACAMAATFSGTDSLVRVHSPDEWVLERLMLRGVSGVVVPRLDTPEMVSKVVETVRYIFPKSFEEKVIVIQIESIDALNRLPEFFDVEEVDCFFLGPVDLSKSCGFHGDYQGAEMADHIAHGLSEIRKAGRSAGMLVKGEDIQKYRAQGANFFYTHANDLILAGLNEFRRKVRHGSVAQIY